MSKYRIDSDFDDLHGEGSDPFGDDVVVDVENSDNPIIKAALQEDKDEAKAKDGQPDEDEFDDIEPELPEDFEEEDEDDEEPEEEDEADDEDEDEEESYSKKVKKRIDRERRAKNRERKRRLALEARMNKLEAKLDRQANQEAFEARKSEIESKLAELKAKKKEAIEEGDTDTQVDIDDEMLDLRAELRTEQSRLKDAQETRSELEDTDDGIDYDSLAPKAREWIDDHPEFRTDKKFQRAVLAADSLVANRGSNPNTDAHYAEIESIIAKDFPDYFDVDDEKPRKRRKPPVTERGKPTIRTKRARRGKVTITRQDKVNMARFGLDPQNPQHVREYAKNKAS